MGTARQGTTNRQAAEDCRKDRSAPPAKEEAHIGQAIQAGLPPSSACKAAGLVDLAQHLLNRAWVWADFLPQKADHQT